MDRDLAKHVAATTLKSMSQLTELVPMLKELCNPAEYQNYLKAIGAVSALASAEILHKVFAAYPEIEQEFEAKISKRGKLM